MGNEHKPKHLVLQEFTKIMYDHNPMGLPLTEMGAAGADEYEVEALSVLSRFTESALHMCEDETLQRELAVGIVTNALQFWFTPVAIKDPEKLGWALLDAYLASFPIREQKALAEVPSEI